MRSIAKFANTEEIWTHVSIPVRKYGYAYSFEGISTYLAVALLCFHAAIVLVHVIYRIAFDCQTFEFGDSLGSLLMLAMGDRAPSGGGMWKQRVAVVPTGNAAERIPLKLEVEATEGQGTELEHVEELELLVDTMKFQERVSRYPPARI
jgi:hypothetical protein